MTREVEKIGPDVDIYYVAGLFLKRPFRRFPVVENGKLIGHITRRDLLRIVYRNLEQSKTGDIPLLM
jgi:CBS domain-containing protein